MDRFFKKVNQKVNFVRRPMPDICPDIAILKNGFFWKTRPKILSSHYPSYF